MQHRGTRFRKQAQSRLHPEGQSYIIEGHACNPHNGRHFRPAFEIPNFDLVLKSRDRICPLNIDGEVHGDIGVSDVCKTCIFATLRFWTG
jgi:hypothetical protein